MKNNLIEIDKSKPLRIFGAFLCLAHLLTAYLWFSSGPRTSSVCWSFFSGCEDYAQMMFSLWPANTIFYGLLSIATSFLFLRGQTKIAYLAFLALTIFKIAYQLTDYRFMGNYHYMTNIVNLLFLFVGEKLVVLRLSIILFYIGAGLLKFNSDWLSGLAMINRPIVTGKLLEIFCAYVIILEIVMSQLLLSRIKWLKGLVFGQLIIFHAFSWHIVGYYYPLIMFCLLPIFWLGNDTYRFPKMKSGIAVLTGLALVQMIPFILNPQSSLNGELRIMSLNMLDAYPICKTRLFIRKTKEVIEYAPNFTSDGVRIQCDPVVIVDHVRKTCRDQQSLGDFVDIDLDNQTRRISSTKEYSHMNFKNVCSHPLSVSPLGFVRQNNEG